MAKPIDDDAEDQDGDRRDTYGKDRVVDSVGGQRLSARVDECLDLIHFFSPSSLSDFRGHTERASLVYGESI